VLVLRCGRLFDGRRMWVRDTQRHRPDECIVVVVCGERITQVVPHLHTNAARPPAHTPPLGGGVPQQVGWESEVGTDVATGAQVIDLSVYTVMPGTIPATQTSATRGLVD